MKRLISSFFLLTFTILTSAQINSNDSTVSIVAYWSLGDKYRFESITERLHIIENDTTLLKRDVEEFTLEVVDSTETYYILKYENFKITSTEEKKTNIIDSLINKKLTQLFEGCPMLLRTNHLGTFEDFHNWEQIKVLLEQAVEVLGNNLWETVGIQSNIFKDKEAFIANAFAPMFRKEIFLAMLKNAILLFQFHGGMYAIDDVYNYTEQRLSPWDGSVIDTSGEAWVENVDEENSYTILCNNCSLNSDQLISSYINYINSMAANTTTPNLTETPYIFIEDHNSVNVHTDTGWPTNVYYELRTEVKTTTHLQIIEVNMLFDDDSTDDDREEE